MTYYNEIDPHCCQWLRNLIAAGLIPDGFVDERSIEDVRPEDLDGYDQCHFFAGIAGWALALQFAGVPSTEPLWTASCPCQPFSGAGKRLGKKDPRHLWPVVRNLVSERKPSVVFGEQVASSDGREWLSGVRDDMEVLDYAFGAADLCSPGSKAPHLRQRLYWVGDAFGNHLGRYSRDALGAEAEGDRGGKADGPDGFDVGHAGSTLQLVNANGTRRESRRANRGVRREEVEPLSSNGGEAIPDSVPEWMGQPDVHRRSRERASVRRPVEAARSSEVVFWDRYDVAHLTDGTRRRIEPGTLPVAPRIPTKKRDARLGQLLSRLVELGHSPEVARRLMKEARSNRVVRLKGYGNAIVPALAAEFIRACYECF